MIGNFITLEGGEGSGKTSLAKFLNDKLIEHGIDVLATREPGGTPDGDKIRKIIVEPNTLSVESELMLITAARKEHIDKKIKPALDAGTTVICDRYILTTYAYQVMTIENPTKRAIMKKLLYNLHETLNYFLMPDLTLILQVPAELGLKRSMKRLTDQVSTETNFEDKELKFHEAIEKAMKPENAGTKSHCIDATQPIEKVQEQAWSIISHYLNIE